MKKRCETWRKPFKVNPEFHRGHLHRGKMLRKSGKCKKALKSLQKASQLKPTDKSTIKELEAASACAQLFEQAEALEKRGDISAARDQYSKILELPEVVVMSCLKELS